ncbi:peptidoglycan-binding protein [Phenylobacterium sp.]|jgi:localization factor PodJL|uniref:peptidoglycan-binding protein n=1 Tax=Phenylobacterium sp. TaxID=1871053 RepID=UPI002F9584CE
MSAGAPWSVKGIDPKAREVAKDLARRSGMTLGEWLNRVILEDDVPEDVTSEDHFTDRPQRASAEAPRPRLVSSQPAPSRTDDMARIAYALDRLTDRIEASETRTGLAISGVEHSVRAAVARIEAGEREHMAVAARVSDDQSKLAERMRRLETESAGPRSAEALRVIEQTVSRVAGDAYETRQALAAMEARLAQGEGIAAGDPSALIEQVVSRLGARLADAEARTALALEGLRGSLGDLDRRLHGVERDGTAAAEQRLEALAASLAERVEAARNEIAEKLKATPSGRVDERFAELAAQVQAAEQRSAEAIDRMGRELLAVAEAFNKRVQASENRSAEAIAKVGGEMVRIAGAVEDRLGRAEVVQAEALEKLGSEIGKITERLTDRMLQSERRTAQAIDDVGEQVSKVTERLEQRHERAAVDMAERLRQSEERTHRLLEEARERLEQGAGAARPAADVDPPLKSTAAFGPELFSRAETEDEAPPAATTPAFAGADFDDHDDEDVGFAPIPEPDEDDIFGLEQPKPPQEALSTEERPLSTREVIEAARANARAAEGSRPKLQVKAKHNWRAAAKPSTGLFGAQKTARPKINSTLQTAFMIVGGAAALSVGAAGMVLINETGASSQAVETSPFGGPPRAAIAITPQPLGPTAPEPVAEAPAPEVAAAPSTATENLAEQFSETVRDVQARKPGALAKLKTIADGGYTPAQFYLATLYENGQAGVSKNPAEARKWTIRAAEGGERMAMYNLGLDYFYGQGGPQDLPAAAKWFRKAAERGLTDAQYNLGMLYQAGSGVERDLAEAYKWFSIAAESGDAPARESAVSLEAKLSPTQLASAERAAKTFRPAGAPEVTVATAQKILGRLGYYKGQPTGAPSRDFKLAVQAYQRDQGLAATGALDPVTAARLSVFTR